VTPAGVVSTVAGSAGNSGTSDGVGSAARFNSPRRLTVDESGTLYVADTGNHTIRVVTADGVVSTLAGSAGVSGSADGAGTVARFNAPRGIAVDHSGRVWVADSETGIIRMVTRGGVVTTIAGDPSRRPPIGYTGLVMNGPAGIGVTRSGQVTVADTRLHVIRQPASTSYLTVVAGKEGESGTADSPIGAANTAARFNSPHGIALGARRDLDAAGIGVVYVADTANHTIRQFLSRPPANNVNTLAGTPGVPGSADGTGASAQFNLPRGVAVDAAGLVYVADTGNHIVRTITSDGVVNAFAGTAGVSGSTDGTGAAARFSSPSGVAVDSVGNVYVADTGNHTIRRITPTGVTTTFSGSAGVSGSANGVGSAARFLSPSGVAVDDAGIVYVADTGNHTIRAIATDGTVSTIGGLAGAHGAVEGDGSTARFDSPAAIASDPSGILYIADTRNSMVRLGLPSTAAAPTVVTPPASQSIRQGQTAQFTVVGAGLPAPRYQWQFAFGTTNSWSNLDDVLVSCGRRVSGSATSTLTIATDVGTCIQTIRLRCVLNNLVGSTVTSEVQLTVNGLLANPTSFTLAAAAASDGTIITTSSPQRVTVTYDGSAEQPVWSATPTADSPWLNITNGTGIGSGSFTASLKTGRFTFPPAANGAVRTFIRLTAPNLGLTTLVPFNVYIIPANNNRAPFGVFDTPSDGARGLSGSIAVTGWALDDLGVDRVELWRDVVPGETTPPYVGPGPGNGKIFIANAFFLEGARPDVERRHSDLPNANRGGWGYLLLTQGLWQQGNGSYTLYAFAYDSDGHSPTIGTKTISVSNASATKPFGALDTPAYGARVSGSFWNYGWALTPNPNTADARSCIITNSNLQVAIDSGPLVPVRYGDLRTDIAGDFPGFSNGNGAGGAYYIDTSTLPNGTHQIGWYVTDSCGRADGIGSRFFTVANGAGSAAVTPDSARRSSADDVTWEPIEVRRNGGVSEWTSANPTGTHVVPIGQSERVEVQLPGSGGGRYTGYQVVNGKQRRLPIGSSLDATAGMFYWQPAAGFLGAHDLEFVQSGERSVVRLRAVVGTAVQAVIDVPQPGPVAPSFVVAGWAIDEAAHVGSGIDTVHVWAYPTDGDAPIFLGAAAYGDVRPDIGALFGEQFARASYNLTVDRLAPGPYDVVVYPHSVLTGDFHGAHVVRVVVR
jgi:sugar lactone lactonase YvrE